MCGLFFRISRFTLLYYTDILSQLAMLFQVASIVAKFKLDRRYAALLYIWYLTAFTAALERLLMVNWHGETLICRQHARDANLRGECREQGGGGMVQIVSGLLESQHEP